MSEKRRVKAWKVIVCLIAGVLALAVATPTIAYFGWARNDFINTVEKSGIFDNDLESKVLATALHRVMYDHMFNNTHAEENDLTPKLLFIGYDGARADLLPLTFAKGEDYSAIKRIANQGTLQLGRVGGATRWAQMPMTGPGWSSIFTGVWADVHGVTSNLRTMSPNVTTIMFDIYDSGRPVSFNSWWYRYHERIFVNEYNASDNLFNFIENGSDRLLTDAALEAIARGDHAVFAIIDDTDIVGHSRLFHPRLRPYMEAFFATELYAIEMIEAVSNRDTYDQEDWMIIIASDHGGFGHFHLADRIMETTIWFAINRQVTFESSEIFAG